MNQGRTGAAVTGRLLLILGGSMVLIIGKDDMMVIVAGLLSLLGGVYILSLVDPSTMQFMGMGWPMKLCKTSAIVICLLMMVSGLSSIIRGMSEALLFHHSSGLFVVIVGLLLLWVGIYILKLVRTGIRS